jgi:enamine deaminase RidA (YjgF/YER057c/UK114 family)
VKAAYLAIVVLFATVFCWSLAAQDGATGLTAQAQQALARAEADVREAGSKKSLWTTALDALKLARDAAAKSDSAAVIEHARTASEQALLGVEQTHYPLVK